ncbi:MAG: 5'-3' exonuclease H3TH domain-containing protein [Halioglobus sp.]|nr:5'-3' exonuclease H3TH domain-containing protein [Halioglobus sp.]
MSAARRAWLIDASIYIFRAWFSLPDRWHTDDGYPLNAVYGYTKFLLDFLESSPDTHAAGDLVAAAFDESLGSNYRNDIYPDYKSSRVLPDEDLAFQLQACRDVTATLGVKTYGCSRYEADDYLATLARLCARRDISVTVVTRDKDLGQIIARDGDRWWDFAAETLLDANGFEQRFGVRPGQFADYLALVGDPVDDIPGVPGVGARTAAALLGEFGNLGELGRRLHEVGALGIRGAGKLQERLAQHWEQVLLARRLTGLQDRVPGVRTPGAWRVSSAQLEDTAKFLEQLGLQGLLPRRCRALLQGNPGA